MKSKGIYNRKEFNLSRSYIRSRLEKEYLAKSYELVIPIIELDIQYCTDQSIKYINDQIKLRG